MSDDYPEYDPSAQYLHLLSLPMWQELRPRLAAAPAAVDAAAGTVVELGPGSGIGTEVVLDSVPAAPVPAVEPSAALRGILLARLAGRPDADRITVYPAGAAEVPLPDQLAAVVGLHMVGHLPPEQRRARPPRSTTGGSLPPTAWPLSSPRLGWWSTAPTVASWWPANTRQRPARHGTSTEEISVV